jgi:large repetitive protein
MHLRHLTHPLLLVLLLLAAAPAAAQVIVQATLTDFDLLDLDSSGGASCSDIVRYALHLGTTDNAADLHDVVVFVPLPNNAEVVNDSVVLTNPHDNAHLIPNPGGVPGISVDFGFICSTAGACAGRPLGARLEFDLRILEPNSGSQLVAAGEVTGSNFPLTFTDDPETTPPSDPTRLDYAPCPPPVLAATKRDVLVVDLDGDGLVDGGDTLRYHVSIDNDGGSDAGSLRFLTGIPANTTFLPGSVVAPPGATVLSTSPLSIDLPTLAPASTLDLSFDVRIDPALPGGVTEVLCQGRASATFASAVDTDDPDTLPGPDPTVTPLDFDPDLALLKAPRQPSAAAGQTAVFDLDWANAGRAGAPAAHLIETVPPHTTFDAGTSSPGWSCSDGDPAGTACTLPLGSVAAGAAGSHTFAVHIAPVLAAGIDSTPNQAAVADDGTAGPDRNPANNAAAATVVIDAAPDLRITKSGPPAAAPGVVAYPLTYGNHGSQGATGVEIVEQVPPHTTFDAAAASPGWSCPDAAPAGTSCTLAVGDLAAGATGSATFTARLAPSAPPDENLVNTAAITDDGANGADLDPSDNTDTAITDVLGPPDLVIAKRAPADALPATTVLYEIDYANRGEQDATGVLLREVVPAPAVFDAASSTGGWSCTDGDPPGTLCTLDLSALTPGASGTATFAVRLPATLAAGVDAMTNHAIIDDDGSHGADPTPGDNNDSVTTLLLAAPDLAVDKDDGGVTTMPGGSFSYTFTVANHGTQDATSVLLTDVLPPGVRIDLDHSSAGWSCTPPAESSPATCSHLLPELPAGASELLALQVQVEALPAEPGILVNSAIVDDDGTNGDDPDPADNNDQEETPVEPAPPGSPHLSALLTDQVLDGAASPGVAAAGAVVSYTTVLTNEGDAAATDVTLLLPPDPHTTLRSGATTSTAGTPTVLPNGTLQVMLPTLESGASLTVTFEVDIDDELPAGLDHLSVQGDVTAANAAPAVTDDPETPAPLDPTRTPLQTDTPPAPIDSIPTVSTLGLAALALLLLAAAARRLRRAPAAGSPR